MTTVYKELDKEQNPMITAEEKRKEASARLELLDLHPDVKQAWDMDGTVYYSEPCVMMNEKFGILYWLHNEDRFMNAVKEFEKEYNALAYHAIYTPTSIGEMLALLYVSDDKETWDSDKADLNNKRFPDGSIEAFAYVVNLNDPIMSEFGRIVFKESGGGLVRTY